MKNVFIVIVFLFVTFNSNSQVFQWATSIGSPLGDMGNYIFVDNAGNSYITGRFTDTINGTFNTFFAKYSFDGTCLWIKHISSLYYNEGKSIAVDSIGYCYIIGYFEDTVDFDPNTGIVNIISVGGTDIFFAKYDENGNFIWAKSIGSTDVDYGYGIATDSIGNCYITGTFMFTADFDPSINTANLSSFGGTDIFFAKYNTNGNYIWAKNIGSVNGDGCQTIAIDRIGNCYLTGRFQSSADFDPGNGTANLTSSGFLDIFFAKYDSNGNYIWAKKIGSTGSDVGTSIVVDNVGNCYLTGTFQNTADFNPGTGTAYLTSIGSFDIFFAKYDIDGNYIWAKNIGSTNADEGNSIAIDSQDNVYITGYFQSIADFDPSSGTANLTSFGSYDIFIAKYTTNGNYLWAIKIGNTSSDVGNSIAIDSVGNCYLTGYFYLTVDFDPNSGIANLSAVGSYDIFIAKYDQSIVSIEENMLLESINIYPNPTDVLLNIDIDEKATLEIINIQGQIVDTKCLTEKVNNLDLSNLMSGVYTLRIKTDRGIAIRKLIKQ